jgi:hypothetical protein
MSKLNISFNNTDYCLDDSKLSTANTDLHNHLSTVLNGTGATVTLGKTVYNIDSAKLFTAADKFTNYLRTISGSGIKVVIDGIEYSVDSTKIQNALSILEGTFNNLKYAPAAAGLYRDSKLIVSWDELLTSGALHVTDGVLTSNYTDYANDSSDVLEGDLVLPEDGTITEIGEYAFGFCKKLVSCTIPASIKLIGDCAFWNCSIKTVLFAEGASPRLSGSMFYASDLGGSLTIPDGITIIPHTAFGSTHITNVVIPASVVTIENCAFQYCASLADITFKGTVDQWNAIEKGTDWNWGVSVTYVQCSDGQVAL